MFVFINHKLTINNDILNRSEPKFGKLKRSLYQKSTSNAFICFLRKHLKS